MTTLVAPADFVAFCSTRRVFGFAHKLGKGWEVQHADETSADPEQEAFDKWELGQEPRLTSDYGFWKAWRQPKKSVPKKDGQQQLGL